MQNNTQPQQVEWLGNKIILKNRSTQTLMSVFFDTSGNFHIVRLVALLLNKLTVYNNRALKLNKKDRICKEQFPFRIQTINNTVTHIISDI